MLLHVAGRLVRGGRTVNLRIQEDWPWAAELVRAFATQLICGGFKVALRCIQRSVPQQLLDLEHAGPAGERGRAERGLSFAP